MMNNTVWPILRVLTISAAFAIATAPMASADKGHGLAFGEPGKGSQASRTITITMRDVAFQPKTIMVRSGETVRFVVKNTGNLLHEFNLGTPEMHAQHRQEMAEMLKTGMITETGINPLMLNMDHSKMDHSKIGHSKMDHSKMDHSKMDHSKMDHSKMDHSKMDMKAPMRHDDPNSVLLEPGKTAELVWKFKEAATLEFSCNVPGHVEAGMVGQVKFTR